MLDPQMRWVGTSGQPWFPVGRHLDLGIRLYTQNGDLGLVPLICALNYNNHKPTATVTNRKWPQSPSFTLIRTDYDF